MTDDTMATQLANPFYYLDNFRMLLDWVSLRYPDLLDEEEATFIATFCALPRAAQALLVRMVMRKGELFRASRLAYDEIGASQDAALGLIRHGWVDPAPELRLEQLFALFTKAELVQLFAIKRPLANAAKGDLLAALQADSRIVPPPPETVFRLTVSPLIDRLRLMFFGNLHQDWTEFVLSDLGIYSFEKVDFPVDARGFQSRFDIEHYQQLFDCRSSWQQGEAAESVLARIDAVPLSPQSWLEQRRARLRFQIGQQYEREQNFAAALALYQHNRAPEARIRWLRVLLRTGQLAEAHALAQHIAQQRLNEAEHQQLLRIVPRLESKLKKTLPSHQAPSLLSLLPGARSASIETLELHLPPPPPDNPYSVEQLAAQALAEADGPVFYVENTLLNSLFGLLCWEAVFCPLPGAFFHPFQRGPADLHSATFYARRQARFDACLSQLQGDDWQHTIRRHFDSKFGLQSPFVHWQILTPPLLELALDCLPPAHLLALFGRMLQDIGGNRSGLPDLIQFWPAQKRYRMIEVKGPGDRLQDNQLRWLDYFAQHRIPALVCHVRYASDTDQGTGAQPS
jgi:hypothetical protein